MSPRQALPVGVAVITKNAQATIEKCLKSVAFCSEIVVVDSGSSDETVAVATSLGARVLSQDWQGYSKQKEFAIAQLNTEWALSLDADEWLTPEAAEEIQTLLTQSPKFQGYRIPRYHFFLGRIIKFGKGVDWPLRLFRRTQGKLSGRLIHEEIVVSGLVGQLQCGMIHWSSPTINERISKIVRDTDGELNYLPGKKIGITQLFGHPLRYICFNFFRRAGWRDGLPGMILIALFSFQIFLQFAKFYEVQEKAKTPNEVGS